MSVCEVRRSEKMSVTTEMNDLEFALQPNDFGVCEHFIVCYSLFNYFQ